MHRQVQEAELAEAHERPRRRDGAERHGGPRHEEAGRDGDGGEPDRREQQRRHPLGPGLAAVPVAVPVPSREVIALHRASMAGSPAIVALLAAFSDCGAGEACPPSGS